jgi:hypothetical protein
MAFPILCERRSVARCQDCPAGCHSLDGPGQGEGARHGVYLPFRISPLALAPRPLVLTLPPATTARPPGSTTPGDMRPQQ